MSGESVEQVALMTPVEALVEFLCFPALTASTDTFSTLLVSVKFSRDQSRVIFSAGQTVYWTAVCAEHQLPCLKLLQKDSFCFYLKAGCQGATFKGRFILNHLLTDH